MSKVFRLYFFIGFCLFARQAKAFDVPALTAPVIDEVGLLSQATQNQLNQSLYQFKQQQGAQIQVYIAKSLNDESIESVAIQIFDKWKLGDAKTDKGILLIIAPNEKRMRIEVGQGLEGDVPDVIAKRIISDVVRPYFQRGEYSLGVLQGVSTLQTYISGGADPELQKEKADATQNEHKGGGGWIILIVIGIWILIFIFNPTLALYILFSGMGGGRGGGGFGGGSGGGWSGGGGSSSGGGASGGW